MAQLVLFDNTDGPGPDEYVVIDLDDRSTDELREEFGATIVGYIDLGPSRNISGEWPTDSALH